MNVATTTGPRLVVCAIVLAALGTACGLNPPMLPPTPSTSPFAGALDCWTIAPGGASSVDLDIPADFFGAGSDPFQGRVDLRGVPLETGGPFELGDTDTVIRRPDDAQVPCDGTRVQVPIEIVQLSLVSVAPITVTENGGQNPTLWDVRVGLEDPAQRDVEGTMDCWCIDPQPRRMNGELEVPVDLGLWFRSLAAPAAPEIPFQVPRQFLQGDTVYDADAAAPMDPLRAPHFELGPTTSDMTLVGSTLTLDLTRAHPDPGAPGPVIDPTAQLDPALSWLARHAEFLPNAILGPGCVVGPNAVVGANAQVGMDCLICEDVQIGDGCVIGDGAILSADVQLGPGCAVGPGAVIGRGSVLFDGTQVGPGAKLGANVFCGVNAQLGPGAFVCNGAQLGDGVQVMGGILVGPGIQVPGGVVADDLLIGQVPGGAEVTGTAAQIEAAGGFVYGLVPHEQILNRVTPANRVTSADPVLTQGELNAAGLGNLQNDVNAAGVGTAAGLVKDRTWVRNTYDCEDFAHDMERHLDAQGYNATITVYWCWDTIFEGEPKRWYWRWEYIPQILRAHAVVDVHRNGRTVWVEPQRGVVGIDLDFDGDGVVEYEEGVHRKRLTDGNYRIEVWPDRATATAAGVRWDD
jgi:carbonic anhydrase/acetyltransferase-like protein (isoleucine patch superfamily)